MIWNFHFSSFFFFLASVQFPRIVIWDGVGVFYLMAVATDNSVNRFNCPQFPLQMAKLIPFSIYLEFPRGRTNTRCPLFHHQFFLIVFSFSFSGKFDEIAELWKLSVVSQAICTWARDWQTNECFRMFFGWLLLGGGRGFGKRFEEAQIRWEIWLVLRSLSN